MGANIPEPLTRAGPLAQSLNAFTYLMLPKTLGGLSRDSAGKESPTMQETWVRSLGWEDSPEGGHGNPLQYSGEFCSWRIRWTEEPGRLESIVSQRVGRD